MTPRSFSHIALSVRDFDRSLHFYLIQLDELRPA